MERLPTEEEWKDWWGHPVTVALRRWVKSKQEGLKDDWANGSFTSEHGGYGATFAANHAAIGAYNAFKDLLGLDYGAFLSEFEEPERLVPGGPSGADQELPSGEDLVDHRDA